MEKTSPAKNALFRPQAVANKGHYYGSVYINTPLPYQLIILFFVAIVFLLLLFFCTAELSDQFIVKGFLNSSKGVLRVFPHKNGIIVQSQAALGKHVEKGEVLFLIDTSHEDIENNQALLSLLIKKKTFVLQALEKKKEELQALQGLARKKIITATYLNRKYEEKLNLLQQKSEIDLTLLQHKKAQAYQIHAPISGTISALMYKEGQSITVSKPLLKILPDGADLIGELFVPVQQSGTLEAGSTVRIRYDAYPYLHFGSYKATLKEISQSILTDEEEEKPITIGSPYYKVLAALETPYIHLDGKEKPLQSGMTFTAVISGNKRKIWQWLLT